MLVCAGKWALLQASRVKGEYYTLESDWNFTAIQMADHGVSLLGVERAHEVELWHSHQVCTLVRANDHDRR